jgi:ArsR family transcriptional regulator, zinc-responsive transcriptional repressor
LDDSHGGALDPAQLRPAGELFQALANPLRLAIVLHLGHEPHCVHDLVELLGVSQPLVSQHLRILRAARLVGSARQGKEVVYSLHDDHVRHIAEDAVRHIQERIG